MYIYIYIYIQHLPNRKQRVTYPTPKVFINTSDNVNRYLSSHRSEFQYKPMSSNHG